MNILEAYIKKIKQIIILILGFPGTNKSEIAKELSIDLNINIIKLNDYLIPKKYKEIIIDNFKFKVIEDSENYDWEKLNNDVNKMKSNGLIIYGNFIDIEKINFDIDLIFFYSINYKLCKEFLIKNNLINFDNSKKKFFIYFENIFIPFFENIKKNLKINKFYNLKEETKFNESYDDIFDYIMKSITNKLKNT